MLQTRIQQFCQQYKQQSHAPVVCGGNHKPSSPKPPPDQRPQQRQPECGTFHRVGARADLVQQHEACTIRLCTNRLHVDVAACTDCTSGVQLWLNR